jgi:hypothetical protein
MSESRYPLDATIASDEEVLLKKKRKMLPFQRWNSSLTTWGLLLGYFAILFSVTVAVLSKERQTAFTSNVSVNFD